MLNIEIPIPFCKKVRYLYLINSIPHQYQTCKNEISIYRYYTNVLVKVFEYGITPEVLKTSLIRNEAYPLSLLCPAQQQRIGNDHACEHPTISDSFEYIK